MDAAGALSRIGQGTAVALYVRGVSTRGAIMNSKTKKTVQPSQDFAQARAGVASLLAIVLLIAPIWGC